EAVMTREQHRGWDVHLLEQWAQLRFGRRQDAQLDDRGVADDRRDMLLVARERPDLTIGRLRHRMADRLCEVPFGAGPQVEWNEKRALLNVMTTTHPSTGFDQHYRVDRQHSSCREC